MRKSRFTEAQIIGMIKEQEAGLPTAELCRKHGLSPATFYKRALRDRFADLLRKLLAVVKEDKVRRRLMTIPGVGPVVTLAYVATIDVPARFRNARSIGLALGLTPILRQSGESSRIGRDDARPPL